MTTSELHDSHRTGMRGMPTASPLVGLSTLLWCVCGAIASGSVACGGSTDVPRPEPSASPPLPGYLDAPAPAATGGSPAGATCSPRADIERSVVQDFELGAAGGWYLSNDVCATCQDFVNAADALRNGGVLSDSSAEAGRQTQLAALQASLDACRPSCNAALLVPNFFDSPPVAEPIPGGRCDSRYAMHIKGGPFLDWGGNMGFAFSPALNVTDFDVQDEATGAERPGQNFQGITFWARLGGTSYNNLRVEVGEKHTDQNYAGPNGGSICTPNTTEDNSDLGCDKFGATATLRGDWQEFVIPFAEMRQAGWGMRAEQFDLTGLLSFSIGFAQGTWDFWIDDLAFYRRKQ
jgi:hypothetical protein